MKKEKVIYLDPVNSEIRQFLLEQCPEKYELICVESGEDLQKVNWDEIDYFITANAAVTKEMILNSKKIKLIQKTGAGVDKIDVEYATNKKVPVATTPGANSDAVAELVILFILALYRKLLELDRSTKNGQWLMYERRLQCFELKNKQIGLVGLGNIGKSLVKRLSGFDVEISYFDIIRLRKEEESDMNIRFKDFDSIISESDIISVHIPLNKNTKGMFDHKVFKRMKNSGIIINTARGSIVDEEALSSALINEEIAGAGIDTYSIEPIHKDNPLLKLNNVITTPHIGAGTYDTWRYVLSIAFENIALVSEGRKPKFAIN